MLLSQIFFFIQQDKEERDILLIDVAARYTNTVMYSHLLLDLLIFFIISKWSDSIKEVRVFSLSITSKITKNTDPNETISLVRN